MAFSSKSKAMDDCSQCQARWSGERIGKKSRIWLRAERFLLIRNERRSRNWLNVLGVCWLVVWVEMEKRLYLILYNKIRVTQRVSAELCDHVRQARCLGGWHQFFVLYRDNLVTIQQVCTTDIKRQCSLMIIGYLPLTRAICDERSSRNQTTSIVVLYSFG